jgi:cytidylate kinase
MAARDDIVLVGLASTIILAGMPHSLRVRITAPEGRRAERMAQAHGLDPAAALDFVRQSNRERGGNLRHKKKTG